MHSIIGNSEISRSQGDEYKDFSLQGADGGRKHFWNVGKHVPDYIAHNPENSHFRMCCRENHKYLLSRSSETCWNLI
jgi:hypothetical protein